MKVTSKQDAWNKINEIFPTDYEQDLGQTIRPIYDHRQFTLITLCVDGDHYIANDTMLKVYDGLKRGETWLASDLIASYCEANDIRWGIIQGISIDHYAHGKTARTAATSWSRAMRPSGSPNKGPRTLRHQSTMKRPAKKSQGLN